MTYQEATQEAIRRWGEPAKIVKNKSMECFVGIEVRGPKNDPLASTFLIRGAGATWEEAFEDATKKGH